MYLKKYLKFTDVNSHSDPCAELYFGWVNLFGVLSTVLKIVYILKNTMLYLIDNIKRGQHNDGDTKISVGGQPAA